MKEENSKELENSSCHQEKSPDHPFTTDPFISIRYLVSSSVFAVAMSGDPFGLSSILLGPKTASDA